MRSFEVRVTKPEPRIQVIVIRVVFLLVGKLLRMGHGSQVIHVAFLAGPKVVACMQPSLGCLRAAFNLMGFKGESPVGFVVTHPASGMFERPVTSLCLQGNPSG